MVSERHIARTLRRGSAPRSPNPDRHPAAGRHCVSGSGGPATEDGTANELGVYRPGAGDLRVRLRLGPSAEWVTASYLTEEIVSRPEGGFEVVLPVSARALLERLLLGLGPEATVLDPPEARTWSAEAAARVLARYERS